MVGKTGPRGTRKKRSVSMKHRGLGLKHLRSAFDHIEKVVSKLKDTSKHSFNGAIDTFKDEWEKTFKHAISPADAAAYLKFRFGLKGKKAMTRRKMKGGGLPLAGAPLDYATRPGEASGVQGGVYGQFPTYNDGGLSRLYGSALSAGCPPGTQKGGGMFDGLFRPTMSTVPASAAHAGVMGAKGVFPFPSADPVGAGAVRTAPNSYITNANSAPWARTATGEIFGSPL
jgi:hypothetical protein